MGVLAMQAEILTFTDPDEVGGQSFKGFPANATEVGEFWAAAFTALAQDLIAPPITVAPALQAAEQAFAATMASLASVPNGGLAAFNAAAVAWVGALASAVLPALLTPPPLPYAPGAGPIGFPVLAPTFDPILPATLIAAGTAAWLATALWTIPPAAPAAVVVAP